MALGIGIFALFVVGFFLWRASLHRHADNTLEMIITAISQGPQPENLNLEIKPGVDPNDFSPSYRILWRDYTFGTWEFVVELKNGKSYYFDFSEYEGSVRAFVKPDWKTTKRPQNSTTNSEY